MVLIITLSGNSIALGSNVISIQTMKTVSGDTGTFKTIMQNDISVNGLHFILRYEPNLITPVKITPVGGAYSLTGSSAFLSGDNKINFLLYDQGFNFAGIDSGSIFEVEYLADGLIASPAVTQLVFTKAMAADSGIMIIPFEFINGEISIDPAVNVKEESNNLPRKFALHQNYPNPFNPGTTVRFELPVESHVTLKVYNIIGQEVMTVMDEDRGAGRYEIDIDSSSMASGVYFYIIRTHSNSNKAMQYTAVKRMLLIK